jgi:hypothetical protein
MADLAALRKQVIAAKTAAAKTNSPFHVRKLAEAEAALEAARDELTTRATPVSTATASPSAGGDAPTGYRMETPLEAQIREGREGALPRLVPVGNSYEPQFTLEDNIAIGGALQSKFGTNFIGRRKEWFKRWIILPFNSALKDGRDGDIALINDRLWSLTDKLVGVDHDIDGLQKKSYNISLHPGFKKLRADHLAVTAAKLEAEKTGDETAIAALQKTITGLENTELGKKNRKPFLPLKEVLEIEKKLGELRKRRSVLNSAINNLQDTKSKHTYALNDRGVLQKGLGLGFYMAYIGAYSLSGGLIQVMTGRAPSTVYRGERRPLDIPKPVREDGEDKDAWRERRTAWEEERAGPYTRLYGRRNGGIRMVQGFFQHFIISPERFLHLVHGFQRNGGGPAWFGKLAISIVPLMYFWAAWSQPVELARWTGVIGKDTMTWASFNHTLLPEIRHAFNPDGKVASRQQAIDASTNTYFTSTFSGKTVVVRSKADSDARDQQIKAAKEAGEELAQIPLTRAGLEAMGLFKDLASGQLLDQTSSYNFDSLIAQFRLRDDRYLKNAALRVGEALSPTQQEKWDALLATDPTKREIESSEFYKTLPETQQKVLRETSSVLMDGNDLLSRIRRINNSADAERALFDAFRNPMLASRDIYAAMMEHNFRRSLANLQKAIAEKGDISTAIARAQTAASERDRPVYLKDFRGVQELRPLVTPGTRGNIALRTKLFDAAEKGNAAALSGCFMHGGVLTDAMHGVILRLGNTTAPTRGRDLRPVAAPSECGRG